MYELTEPPSASTLIDVIVLAFARSTLRDLVGTGALRSVLEDTQRTQRTLFPELGTMSLQPVWELLEAQPGFQADKAIAPMCRIKQIGPKLHVNVVMPQALDDIDAAACEKHALDCRVSDEDLDKLLRPRSQKNSIPLARVLESGPAGDQKQERKKPRTAIAFAIFAVGVTATVVSLYRTLSSQDTGGGSNKTVTLSPHDVSDDIPLNDVRKSGELIVGIVSDPSWAFKPEPERRSQIEATREKIQAQDASGLMLLDRSGLPVGSLMLRRNPQILFPPPRPHL